MTRTSFTASLCSGLLSLSLDGCLVMLVLVCRMPAATDRSLTCVMSRNWRVTMMFVIDWWCDIVRFIFPVASTRCRLCTFDLVVGLPSVMKTFPVSVSPSCICHLEAVLCVCVSLLCPLSVCVCVCVCVCVYHTASQLVSVSVILSVHLLSVDLCLPVCQPICLFVSVCVCLSLSVCLSLWLAGWLSGN